MRIDLFSQALVLVLCFAIYGGLSYILFSSRTIHYRTVTSGDKKRGWRWHHIGIVIIAGLAMGIAIRLISQAAFPQDVVPWEMAIWTFPIGVALALFIYTIHQLWPALVSCATLCGTVVLALLLTNNYYHYYPTLDALINQTPPGDRQVALPSSAAAPSDHTVLEQYYQPLPNQPKTGRLIEVTIPSSGGFSPKAEYAYLPPALSGNDKIRLPVVVLLPGYPGKPVDWVHMGLSSIMDSFAAKHKGLAPIVVVADINGTQVSDTECVDSSLGRAETYLTKDVPAYIASHFQASANPNDWTVAGLSAGGTCSTMLALRHPSIYHNYMNVSGDAMPSLHNPTETLQLLFGGSKTNQDSHTPDLLLAKGSPEYKTMNAWYFMGEQDKAALIKHMTDQAALASKAGLTVKFVQAPGHHDFLVWKQGYVDGLPWMMNRIGLTANEK